MTTDVRPASATVAASSDDRQDPASTDPTTSAPATDTRTHARRGAILVAVAVWQVWLWGTRLWNMVQDAGDFSVAFVAVHVALFVASFGLAVVLATMGLRMRREARSAAP